jgi:hypothetical protein
MNPQRIQRRRTKGWRMPEGAVYVGRPTKWGNPFDWTCYPKYVTPTNFEGDNEPVRVADAERRRWAATDFDATVRIGVGQVDYPATEEIRAELSGKDLACWCAPGQSCHADVLLKIANGGSQ